MQLDQEFTVDFSEGELRADMISELSPKLQPNQDASEITSSGNYTVSPWELSVRLHEVIQSRLEARVKSSKWPLSAVREDFTALKPSRLILGKNSPEVKCYIHLVKKV